MTAGRSPPLPRLPRLMLVTDRHRGSLPLPDVVAAAIAGGCDAIQVREKDLSASERGRLVEQVRRLANGRATVLVNGDLELAAIHRVGLHLPEDGLAPAAARSRLGPAALIGRSVHSPPAAAASEGVDYLLAGNVFPTESHPGRAGLGLAGLAAIIEATSRPVLAIGGIAADNVAAVVAAGAEGVAVVGALASATTPEEAEERAADLRGALDHALAHRSGTRSIRSIDSAGRQDDRVRRNRRNRAER